MFKGLVIEYGYYVVVGIVSGILAHYIGIAPWKFWLAAILGIVYHITVPSIQHLAWGKDH